jgi:CHASE3 domain sensor protein
MNTQKKIITAVLVAVALLMGAVAFNSYWSITRSASETDRAIEEIDKKLNDIQNSQPQQ